MFTDAGFQNIRIIIGVMPVRYSSVKEFASLEVASSPLAGLMKSNTEVFDTIIAELETTLQTHVDDNGIVFPAESYLVTAQRL